MSQVFTGAASPSIVGEILVNFGEPLGAALVWLKEQTPLGEALGSARPALGSS
jgi:hypothetical protein